MPEEGWEKVLRANKFALTNKLQLRHDDLALLEQLGVLRSSESQQLQAISEVQMSKRAYEFLEILNRKTANHYKNFYRMLIQTDQGALGDILEPQLATARQQREQASAQAPKETVMYRPEQPPPKADPHHPKPAPVKPDQTVTSGGRARPGGASSSGGGRNEGTTRRPVEESGEDPGDTSDNAPADEKLKDIRVTVKQLSNPHTVNLGGSREVYDVTTYKNRVWVEISPLDKRIFKHEHSPTTFTRLDTMRKQIGFEVSEVVKFNKGHTKVDVLTRVNDAARTKRAAMMIVVLEGVGYLTENAAVVFGKAGSSEEITWEEVAAAMNTAEMMLVPKILLIQITDKDDLFASGSVAFDAKIDPSSFGQDFYVVASKLKKQTEQMLLLNYFVSVVENFAHQDDFQHMMTMVEGWMAKKQPSQPLKVLVNSLQRKLFFFPIPESS